MANRGLYAPVFMRSRDDVADEIEIPESAFVPKPWFGEEPSEALVTEIKAFVKQTGTPYLWRGHRHTKPDKGALIRYKGEFDLPASHAGRNHRHLWSPCPCCKPRSPWFYKDGKIAWFPEEKLIRLIGPDCFKAINAQGHKEAEEIFRAEEERKNTERYLLKHIVLVPHIIQAATDNLSLIRDIDRLQAILSRNMPKLIGFDLWQHIRTDGALKIEVTRTEQRVDRSGNQSEVTVQDFQRYGPIAGGTMLKPNASPIEPRVERQVEILKTINFGEAYVARMDQEERKATVKKFRSVGALAELFAEAEEMRRFLSPISLGSLNGWGKLENAPARLHIEITPDYMQLLIGNTREGARSIPFRPTFFDKLRAMPDVAKTIKEG
jgi:hypothetical protein